jgi:glycosyltransferase involved in cell wall biosynthesis
MAASLRIVLALESSGPGGAENLVLRLAEALRAGGDEPIIASMRSGWMTERAQSAGFPVWIEPQKRGVDLGWVARFAGRLRRERIDVLHAHEFAMNIFGGAAALLSRTPAVSTIHGRNWATGRPLRARAYRMLRILGIPLVTVSNDLAEFLREGLGLRGDQLRVIHNGIPIPESVAGPERDERRRQARLAIGLPESLQLLVAVGNLYPVKDHATLLRALPELPGVRVAIAGRGQEEEALLGLARELAVEDRVHLLGLRDDVHTLLEAADVFVHPSRSEGLPLALLEAMAHRLPVVATHVGGIPEAARDGETAFLVAPGDCSALAGAIRRFTQEAGIAAAFADAGRARIEADFSIEVMASRYRALFIEKGAGRR